MAPAFEPITKLRFSRRELLRLMVMLSAWLPARFLLAAAIGENPETPPAFGPFLDTLLPEDESASATQLGVDTTILDAARDNRNLMRIIELGCAWLDRAASEQGAIGFAELAESQRIAIVTTAEQSSSRSLPRVFFNAIRQLAFKHYYAQAVTWQSLGYAGPPQPKGFPGHDQPPRVTG